MSVPIFQFNLAIDTRTFHNEFVKLIELGRNDQVKSLVTNYATIYSSSIVDSYGVTLLHLTAKYNNVELIDFLVKSGDNVNVRNSLGETPLVTALYFDKTEAIETLINANADIVSVNDIEHVLRLLIAKKNILSTSILTKFMQKLRRCYRMLNNLSGLLLKVHCPLMFVVYAGDSLLTQMMLDISDYEIKNKESFETLQYVMKKGDFENWRVLCQSNRLVRSRNTLFSQVEFSPFCVHWKYMRPLFKCLTDWMTLDSSFINFLNKMLSSVDKYDVQILLNQYNIDKQIMQKYNINILPIIFANYRLDLEYLAVIARKRLSNINDMDFEGLNALHYAVMDDSVNTVRLLLELGADCNMKDRDGRTPLTYAYNVKCMELLLQNGADLHFSNNDVTVFELWLVNTEVTKFLLAQLATDRCQGVPIKQEILEEIKYKPIYRDCYEECLKQVEDMMNCEIFTSVTVFDIVTGNSKILTKFVKNRETITRIMKWCSQQFLHSYYCSSLAVNLEKAYNVYLMKCRVAVIISKSTTSSRPISYDHLVVDRISDFLLSSNYKDILVFVSA